ncbi:hypothetical protein Ahy_A07g033913 isoform B [Arachis hypogaea]|uniref:DUF7912 domain-containing protein n=1 Tax=Arachis hypogaea TaxID=3818 RepID=A0A445CAF3_ARAHY|nr:hypothetical protein Ahy_A07g033913 isoform A [Arachis hypogaea]RYR47932.1 hypothetical protein Ahy_A07g033913 isoform B [Arachis hypogaea]
MYLIKASNLTPSPLPFFTTTTKFSSHFCTFLCNIPRKPLALRAKKRTSDSEPLLEPSLLQEVSFDDEEEDDELLDEFEFDIEAFSTTYRTKLDEAEIAKFVPENLSLEVSSPGVERIVRIPTDLDRFKDRPMYVNYSIVNDSDNSSAEGDGVFRLESFDMETKCCTWGIADVRVNRGKGRPLNKKQREWRLSTPFDSLRLVRLHSDI